jgi:hypothetical protein
MKLTLGIQKKIGKQYLHSPSVVHKNANSVGKLEKNQKNPLSPIHNLQTLN